MFIFPENLLIKSRNQNIFEKFKLNRNLQTIPFNMMYNMSMLRHRFSNERWAVVVGGGEGGTLNHLPLLFCKSVYKSFPCIDLNDDNSSSRNPFTSAMRYAIQTFKLQLFGREKTIF